MDLEKIHFLSFKKQNDQNYVSKIKYQQRLDQLNIAKSHVVKAKINLDLTEINLSRATLRAPFDLVIDKRYVQHGQVIAPYNKAFEVYRLKPLEVKLTVPEKKNIRSKNRAVRSSENKKPEYHSKGRG